MGVTKVNADKLRTRGKTENRLARDPCVANAKKKQKQNNIVLHRTMQAESHKRAEPERKEYINSFSNLSSLSLALLLHTPRPKGGTLVPQLQRRLPE